MTNISALRSLLLAGAVALASLGSGCIVDVTVPTYDECVDSADCRNGDVCVRVITTDSTGVRRDGKQCSRFCGSDAECPSINGYAGACYMISSDPDFRNFTCYARCDIDADCDFNQDCVPVTGPAGADAICLPAF
jgi:hypothetical protein